jgi:hypothetical protein
MLNEFLQDAVAVVDRAHVHADVLLVVRVAKNC